MKTPAVHERTMAGRAQLRLHASRIRRRLGTLLKGAACLLPLLALPARADLLVYEGFDYPASDLSGLSGGAGWNGGWVDVNGTGAMVIAGSLTAGVNAPTGYDARSTGQAAFLNTFNRAGRLLDCSPNGPFGLKGYLDANGRVGANEKTLYLSFLQQPGNTVKYYEFEFHRGDLGDPGRIAGIGNDTGTTDVYLRAPNNNHTPIGAGDTAVNLYVVKIVFHDGNDDVYVYRNPTGATEEENTPALVAGGVADMSFDGLSFGAFDNGLTVAHDQIRVGESWKDVIGGAPGFIVQPKSQVVRQGEPVTLIAAAQSDEAVTYQWYKGAGRLNGANNATFSLASATLADAGNYSVVASNSLGSVTSLVAVVTVNKAASYLLAYEGFDYTDPAQTNLAGMNGGAGWNGNWVNVNGVQNWINAGSLVAGGNAPAGYDARSSGNSGFVNLFNRAGRLLDVTTNGTFGQHGLVDGNGRIGADGTTLYLSFLQQPNTAGKFYEFEFHRGDLGDPGRIGGIGNDSDLPNVYLRAPNGAKTLIGAGDTAVNFYVVRIDFLPGADTVYVYRNPVAIGETNNVPAVTAPFVADMSFDGLSMAAFVNTTTVTHDQIRLGLSWEDVIGGPPGFTSHPKSRTNYLHSAATFSVTAASDAAISYQWYHNANLIAGQTTATLTIPSVEVADAGQYSVNISNALGNARSVAATLTVVPLVITQQPQNQLVYLNSGSPAFTLTGGVTGSQPIAYQWYRNGAPVAGATNATLTLANSQVGDAGDYFLVGQNSFGAVTSTVATVTIYAVNNRLLAYDGFAYETDTSIAGQNGGLGWQSAWAVPDGNGVFVVANPLVGDANVPAGYDSRSISNTLEVYGVSRAGRYLDCTPTGALAKHGFINNAGNIGADGKTLYVSFLQRPLATAKYYEFEFHRGNLSDPGRIGGIGNDTGTDDVNLRAPNGTHTSIGLGDTAVNFYVVRIDYRAGDDDVRVYRNVTSTSEPAVPTLERLAAADMSFNGVSVAAFVGNDVVHDEIRVGATWEDALGLAVSNLLPGIKTANGWKVRFAATPGFTYHVERAATVAGPWTEVGVVVGPANGLGEFEDPAPLAGQGFYRTVTQ